jgi:hypothetical protein
VLATVLREKVTPFHELGLTSSFMISHALIKRSTKGRV